MKVSVVHAFEDNYIWLLQGSEDSKVAIVDPGDADPVIEWLQAHQLQPSAILITHHHGDHTGGIAELRERYDVEVYGPAHERVPGIDHRLQEGDVVSPTGTGLRLEVLDVPGHTLGHIAYYGEGALFCGDTLFTGGCGRIFEGSPEQMYQSLEKLRALPDETLVYCAHEYTLANLRFARVAEPDNEHTLRRLQQAEALRAQSLPTVPSRLELEKATNPFLRSHVPELASAAEAFAGSPLSPQHQVFACVRRWKDSLD